MIYNILIITTKTMQLLSLERYDQHLRGWQTDNAVVEYGLHPVNSQHTYYNPQTGTENLLDLLIETEDDDSALHSIVTRSVNTS